MVSPSTSRQKYCPGTRREPLALPSFLPSSELSKEISETWRLQNEEAKVKYFLLQGIFLSPRALTQVSCIEWRPPVLQMDSLPTEPLGKPLLYNISYWWCKNTRVPKSTAVKRRWIRFRVKGTWWPLVPWEKRIHLQCERLFNLAGKIPLRSNGNPPVAFILESPMNRAAWWAVSPRS